MAPAAPSGEGKGLRSEGLLPALGVGAVVYFTTGLVSLSTLGLVGVGAGVGYGVGSWAVDKFREMRCKNAMDRLHPALKVALQQWQAFLASRVPGRQPTHEEAAALFAEFEQMQPSNAEQVRNFVQKHGGSVGGMAMSA
uniref:Uncharacterized protein n=1 Tax=Alexandrium monilatum TaxID=311494 RepID=A0A7S4PWQ8_9DINO|mmetsp:Transcript_21630/g.65008  ORF Transcript_21630/g.65008 Transcript_21630/m.65008 type:complete len:139 (-) Transcript_21630:60-476(-)